MTTATTTLADWLLERLADDQERAEFVARQTEGNNWTSFEEWRLSWHDEYDLLCIEPTRALREVAAKRRLVERASRSVVTVTSKRPSPFGNLSLSDGRYLDERGRDVTDEFAAWHAVDGEPADMDTLRALASVYAGAPGWREEWSL